MKHQRLLYFFILIQTILIFNSCAGGDYSKDLSGGYFFRAEGKSINDILSKDGNRKEIPSNVLNYDFNNDFIIASQKPNKTDDPLYENNPEYPNGRNEIYYWLIVHSDRLVLGPMNKQDFDLTLKKFNVPIDLKLDITND